MEKRYAHQWSAGGPAEEPVVTEVRFSERELLAMLGLELEGKVVGINWDSGWWTVQIRENVDHTCTLLSYRKSPGPDPWQAGPVSEVKEP